MMVPVDDGSDAQWQGHSDHGHGDESRSVDRQYSADRRYEEFVMLFARTEPALHSFVLSLVPNWADAEEILQQTSFILWRKFDQFEPGSSFRHWACQIARFEVLNFRKKHRRDRHLFCDELFESLTAEAVEQTDLRDAERHALADCLTKLPENLRELVGRCYAEGATVRQVAEQLGRSANSVYKRLNRTRETLLKCIRRTLSAEGC